MANEINETTEAALVIEPEGMYFDPLAVIETLTNSLFALTDCELTEVNKTAIENDFTAVMFQCTKLIKAVIKDNIKTLNEPPRETK